MLIKNKTSIEKMRIAGRLLAQAMQEIEKHIKEGVTTLELDSIIEKNMRKQGLKPECKGYGGYQYATCISLNEVIVHGVPSKDIVLKSGDFVKIDVVGSYKGYCADIARYFFVGQVSPLVKKMANVIQLALDKAIEKAIVGNKLSDVSATIQKIIEDNGFSVIRHFSGHGIGRALHEEPSIPNYVDNSSEIILQEGMTLALEPMMASGDYDVKIMSDGWTAMTADGGLAAHVEDTIAIGKNGAEILTRMS
jgi:methionyl aminopeptidase